MEIVKDEYAFVELTWSEFVEQFKPIKNHFRENDESYLFETYGEEVEFVKSVEPNRIWTFADGDMCSYVSSGWHYVNRLGYHITEIPFDENKDYQIIISTEEECECYNEDEDIMEQRGGEYGDPDCQLCEGSGLVTKYAD